MASILIKNRLSEEREREFKFTGQDFNFIKKLVGDQTGIVLSEAKINMVYSRLARRLRALGLDDFKDYLGILKDEDQAELVNFVNAITTNLTAFFRENHHFEYLENQLIPHLLKKNAHTHRLRIWSAGCSTGEEPYSIAITLRETIPNIKNWDVKILATDLDTNVVNTASKGVYTEERVSGISKPRLKKWFRKGSNSTEGMVKVSSELQDLIAFKQLNLMNEWPLKGPFDLIFCRNVVIYFSKDTQRELVARYHKVLDDEGHLFLGHSESLFKVSNQFDLIGNTIYKKLR